MVLWPRTERAQSISIGVLHIEPGGFDRKQFRFAWIDAGSPKVLAVDDPAVADAIRHNPPPGLREEILRFNAALKKGRLVRTAGWAALGGLIVAPVVVLAVLWWQVDRIVDLAVAKVPPAWEERFGDEAYRRITAESVAIPSGAAVDAVETIGRRLTSSVQSPYTFHWHVIDENEINAFAMPGGHVVVYTGLLRAADSADEVAGVLAHEMQHVLLRHSLRVIVRDLGFRAVFALLWGGDMGTLSTAGQMASRLGSLKFGREQETAADVEGLALLRRARVDPHGMVRFFQALAQREDGGIQFLSTHPMSRERAAYLEAEIGRLQPWPIAPLGVEWSDVRASLAEVKERTTRETSRVRS